MIIKLIVDGAEMKPGPVVAQKIGPMGINMGMVISEVNKATSEFKGMKVPVVIDLDPKTKKFKIEVYSPSTSELLKKEVGVEKGTGARLKNTIANASIEQVIKVAKIKQNDMLSKEFKSAVKSVAGSCTSLGILVEDKIASEIAEDIDNGIYDHEIKSMKTETSLEKKVKLKAFMDAILKKQEEQKKAEEIVKAAEEAAKLAAQAAPGAKPAEGAAAPGATPGEAAPATAGAKSGEAKATTPAGKPAPAGKKEEKKK